MRITVIITLVILIFGSCLIIPVENSMAEDSIPFENDTRETATVLGMGSRDDSISLMDYYDYYKIEADLIDLYRVLYLTITFIDVPGSGFIEVRTYLTENERDYAYLDRVNTSKSIAFDSEKTSNMDLYVEISGYGNYSIQLKGEKGRGGGMLALRYVWLGPDRPIESINSGVSGDKEIQEVSR